MSIKYWKNKRALLQKSSVLAFLMFFLLPYSALSAGDRGCLCEYTINDLEKKEVQMQACIFVKIFSDTDITPDGCKEQYCLPKIKDDFSLIMTDYYPEITSSKIVDEVIMEYKPELQTHISRLNPAVVSCEENALDTDTLIKPITSGTATVREYVIPKLGLRGLDITFSQPLQEGNKLKIDFIGQYLTGVYRWLLGASLTIAIIIIMVGGVQYVLSSGSGNVSAAKERIINAVIGFVLLLSTYIILYTINPELIMLRPLTVEPIPHDPGLPFGEGEEDYIQGGQAVNTGTLKFPVADNIYIPEPNNALVTEELAKDLIQVAKALQDQGYGMMISSGYRPIEKQIALIKQNCQNPPGSSKCDPKPDKVSTCILRNMDPKNCPHTTARAVDIWAAKAETPHIQCIYQKECNANKDACRNNPCQKALIQAMRDQGFCVLDSEPWHFEKPKMSRTCR